MFWGCAARGFQSRRAGGAADSMLPSRTSSVFGINGFETENKQIEAGGLTIATCHPQRGIRDKCLPLNGEGL